MTRYSLVRSEVVGIEAERDDLAATAARELSAFVWERHKSFVNDYSTPDKAVDRAADALGDDGTTDEGPFVLVDVGDNPGGGGVGDRTDLLEALLDRGVDPVEGGVAVVWDSDSAID